MTAYELKQIQENKHQTPRSMAEALGINVNTYYLWARGRPIPHYFQLAIKFLATQDLPKIPPRHHGSLDASRAKFAPGSRFGRLVVLGEAPKTGGSRHRRLKVQCDCGDIKVMRVGSLVEALQCSFYCPLNGTVIPAAKPLNVFTTAPPDPDEPDFDAPDIEWRKYNDRKEREKRVELQAATDALSDAPASDPDLDAAFDALNDTPAACDDQIPLESAGTWEDGL